MNYPQLEQFETRDRELRTDLRLLREQDGAAGRSRRANRLQRLVALTVARVGGR